MERGEREKEEGQSEKGNRVRDGRRLCLKRTWWTRDREEGEMVERQDRGEKGVRVEE